MYYLYIMKNVVMLYVMLFKLKEEKRIYGEYGYSI